MDTLLFFAVGTVFGSFFGLMIDRLPKHSILLPSSHCSTCKQKLMYRDLMPILSQLLSRSKCRYCGVTLPYWYAILEFLCGALFVTGWFGKLDLSLFLICLASLLLTGFDLKNHSFPLLVWLMFFLLLIFTSHITWLVLACLLLALLTELLPLKMGSGDWLYLSLVSFAADFFQLTLCLFLASLAGILYYLVTAKGRHEELAFLPFLFLSYLCVHLLTA
jgi:leader peptidase (prepilin peptidase)/N-methyltransferase